MPFPRISHTSSIVSHTQVKNAESARYKSLSELNCQRRLLLTGTPIENSPKELLSLLGFLLPELFSVKEAKEDHKERQSKKQKKEVCAISEPLCVSMSCVYPPCTLYPHRSKKQKKERRAAQRGAHRAPAHACQSPLISRVHACCVRYRRGARRGSPRCLRRWAVRPRPFLARGAHTHATSRSSPACMHVRWCVAGDEPKARARTKRIRALIGPFVLRRLKSQVLDALPPKSEEVASVALTPTQRTVYETVIARIAAQHKAREESKTVTSDFITSSFTLLRKAALHPMLLPSHYGAHPDALKRIARVLHQVRRSPDP